jgi:hypothetical protein
VLFLASPVAEWTDNRIEQGADRLAMIGHEPIRNLDRAAHPGKAADERQRDEDRHDPRDHEGRVATAVPLVPAAADMECAQQLVSARIAQRPRLESLERRELEAVLPVEDPQRADRQPTDGAVVVVDNRQ